MEPIFIVAWVMSVVFTLLIGAGVVIYIARTWQQIRSHGDGSVEDRLLDGIDQLQTQLYLLGERLTEIERRLPDPDTRPPQQLPAAGSEGTAGGAKQA